MCIRISEKEVNGVYIKIDRSNTAKSEYCWLNLESTAKRIGKVRMKTGEDRAIVYSIMIYPQYQLMGIAGNLISFMKNIYRIIIAHNVRYSAIGFWRNQGFKEYVEGQYIWKSI